MKTEQLERLAKMTMGIEGEFYLHAFPVLYRADEQKRQDEERKRDHQARLCGRYPLLECHRQAFHRIKETARTLKAAPSGETLEALFMALEQAEFMLAQLEAGIMPSPGGQAQITGAQALELARIAASALGLRYAHAQGWGRDGKEAAADRLFSALEGGKG